MLTSWREIARCSHDEIRCCHLLTYKETSIGWVMSSTPLAKGGVLSLARADVARARRRAWACAPSRPPSSMAKGTRMWGPPCIAEICCREVLSARNFLSSACFAAEPGTVATFSRTLFLSIVVITASMTKCRPSAKKSRATTSPSRECYAARKPLASCTTYAPGTPASRKMTLMTPTRHAWNKWRIPPIGHLMTTWRFRDSLCPALIPH